jgi:hypothetical protein
MSEWDPMLMLVCGKRCSPRHIHAEWNLGGLPLWLKSIDGMQPRTNTTEWEQYMQTFVTLIADMIEPYLARNGGPVILAQVCCFCCHFFPCLR